MVGWIHSISPFLLSLINHKTVSTVVVIGVILLVRSLLIARVREANMVAEQKRRWLVEIRNATLIFVALSVVLIWGEELRGLAISLVAVVAAMVLALKELILCLTGAMLKAGSGSFRIGDRVEIMSLRGEVIDHDLLTTTLLELGPGLTSHQKTGRRLVLPNSLLLSHAVINESSDTNFVLHLFIVPMKRAQDWVGAESVLLQAAQDASREYIEQARQAMEQSGRQQGIVSSRADPRVTLQFPGADDVQLVVRLAVPVAQRGVIEQQILRAFGDFLQQQAQGRGAAGNGNEVA